MRAAAISAGARRRRAAAGLRCRPAVPTGAAAGLAGELVAALGLPGADPPGGGSVGPGRGRSAVRGRGAAGAARAPSAMSQTTPGPTPAGSPSASAPAAVGAGASARLSATAARRGQSAGQRRLARGRCHRPAGTGAARARSADGRASLAGGMSSTTPAGLGARRSRRRCTPQRCRDLPAAAVPTDADAEREAPVLIDSWAETVPASAHTTWACVRL